MSWLSSRQRSISGTISCSSRIDCRTRASVEKPVLPRRFFDSPSFSIYWSFVEPAYIVEPHIQHHFIPFERQRSIFFSTRAETHYEFVNKRIVNRGIPIRRIEEHAKVRIVPHRITASSDGSFRGSDRIDGDDIKVFRPKLTRRDDGPGGAGPRMPDKNRGSAWYNVDQMKKNPAGLSPHPRYNAGPSDDDPRNGKGDFGRDGRQHEAEPCLRLSLQRYRRADRRRRAVSGLRSVAQPDDRGIGDEPEFRLGRHQCAAPRTRLSNRI